MNIILVLLSGAFLVVASAATSVCDFWSQEIDVAHFNNMYSTNYPLNISLDMYGNKAVLINSNDVSVIMSNWKLSFSNLSCTCDQVDIAEKPLANFHVLNCRGNFTQLTRLTSPWGPTNQWHNISIIIYTEYDNVLDLKIIKQRLYSNLKYVLFPYDDADKGPHQVNDLTSHIAISDKWIIIPSQVDKCNPKLHFYKIEYYNRQTRQSYVMSDKHLDHDCSTINFFSMMNILWGGVIHDESALSGLGLP